ncbi:MBL fold metallo-hydrolase [Kaistia algarum]|uniref:MBL fold metallo-hydrolase n=1 Tax=Kaistia algarum TaxID=2083279 RepID=UPI0014023471|nr:MBL fold metallo-hydrolase [Kaistia algarum]MCX5515770.1 MBL fold metallo-hydrolase [Kaistia algarum]
MALELTWLGQSGLLLRDGSRTVLVDPWLSPSSERASPPPDISRLPQHVDLLLITHGHGDHLDPEGLQKLAGWCRIAEILAPDPHLGTVGEALRDVPRLGARPGQRIERLGGISVIPAWHGVTVSDGYGPMIAADGTSPHVGYFFVLGGVRVYVSGDTISDAALIEAARPLRPSLVFLPVNGRDAGREARGILGNMSADEAVRFALAVGADTLVPLHHDGVTGNTAEIGQVAHAAACKPLHLVLPARSIPLVIDGNRP